MTTPAPGDPNLYADHVRAEAYAALDESGTYGIAFRDLREAIAMRAPAHALAGRGHPRALQHGHPRALDFGCGAGRSSRFLAREGFEVVGVDISAEMVARARASDPAGDYRLIAPRDLETYAGRAFSLILLAWSLDNVHEASEKLAILVRLHHLVTKEGRVWVIASTPELYVNEWQQFTPEAFPENARARSGDRVRIRIRATSDDRPYEDTLFDDAHYRALFDQAGYEVRAARRPLGLAGDAERWRSEETTAPWVLYELAPTPGA